MEEDAEKGPVAIEIPEDSIEDAEITDWEGERFDYTWNFFTWVKSKESRENWDQQIEHLWSCKGVAIFWEYYNQMIRPNEMGNDMNFYFFKEGIKPAWEAPENASGGKWTINIRRPHQRAECLELNQYWEKLSVAVASQEIMDEGLINGIEFSARAYNERISVW
eukprot:CAMPEP_0167740412 /NCGR_PEP_ID=MMETSP0110_2-20121227/262_1 /TAXON_ID=629695 /ORGANISM="Gymnochlora sp., Strain CCMP2014" /LENGTH=163 /DNA_ID=CAMNT_0007624301 /DNA_START=418 /DNA_END=906 /DNA_ORIENTATION=+